MRETSFIKRAIYGAHIGLVRGPVGPTMHSPGDFFSWVPTCLLVSTEWYSIMFP